MPTRGSPEGRPTPLAQLFEDYEKDVVRADKEYLNVILRIESTIKSVGTEGDRPVVVLFVPIKEGGAAIQCQFAASSAEEVAKLKTGGSVTIVGRCAGVVNAGVTLDQCRLVRYGPPKGL
ncbi:MAG: OB-fold putative lipoprotein [Gemmataceae bacterium]|nr:OB-fold putative lipoprotein [Gemmataceae bacterium]